MRGDAAAAIREDAPVGGNAGGRARALTARALRRFALPNTGWRAPTGFALAALLAWALAAAGCAQAPRYAPDDLLNPMLGGETTVALKTSRAFSAPAAGLSTEERRRFEVGDSFFTQNWVTAPASTEARDGLGPTFNAQSCSSCHTHDGRAKPPDGPDDPERGLLFRLSVPGTDAATGGPMPHPIYGGQLQDRAVIGVPPEGRAAAVWREIRGEYADGEPYSLIKPEYALSELAFGAIGADTMISPRIAPAMIGMGLLEAVPEEDTLALADPDDADGDGISGRANMVWDIRRGALALGRFGWKAGVPTVEQQAAAAFHGDIGITSPMFPRENCPPAQTACQAARSGGEPELPQDRLDKITFYNRTLAVPAMRDTDDPQVRLGAEMFLRAGCQACHTPIRATGDIGIPALSGQTILPYTDLLLHDMGEGLADGRPEFLADGREWRTPPLWGIGLVDAVNRHTRFLHDGRARSLAEAILWHGGEGSAARDMFIGFSREEREALLRFLEAL